MKKRSRGTIGTNEIVPFGENQSGRSYAVRSAGHRTLTEGTSRPGVTSVNVRMKSRASTARLWSSQASFWSSTSPPTVQPKPVAVEMVPKSTVDPLGRSKRGSDRKQ